MLIRPKVTVILPVYNEVSDFLNQSIESILAQSYNNLEILIIDDCSTVKECIYLIDEYQRKDPRIKLHRWTKNIGLTESLNKGLQLASGEYICRQDSDDWSDPLRIEKQVLHLELNSDIGIIGSNVMLHQENGKALWKSNFPLSHTKIKFALPYANPFAHGSVCFRKSIALKIGGYSNDLKQSQDYDFFWRFCEHCKGGNLPNILYHYRKRSGSISANHSKNQLIYSEVIKILGKNRLLGNVSNTKKIIADISIRKKDYVNKKALLKSGDELMLSGNYYKAFRVYLHGILKHRILLIGNLKLFRLIAFIIFPRLRNHMFKKPFT